MNLGPINDNEDPVVQVSLFHIPLWVQKVGEGLGNYVAKFREYDDKGNLNFLRAFMRIRVMLDVTKPVIKSKKVKKIEGKVREVNFKYESMGSFCYISMWIDGPQ